jgi:hypothetical protein
MATRYAIIVTNNDGLEEVSNIAVMEGGPPDVREGNAKVIKINDAVKIGMVKGGQINAVDGWGFPGDPATPGSSNRATTDDKPKRGRPVKAKEEPKEDEKAAA